MSIEGKIEVVRRVIREEELLLEQLEADRKLRSGTIARVEDSLESDKKRLKELENEACFADKAKGS